MLMARLQESPHLLEVAYSSAEWMRSNVPGVVIPDEIVRRIGSLPAEKQLKEGKRICVEIIQQVQEIPGVRGVHVMAYRQEQLVCEVILWHNTVHCVDFHNHLCYRSSKTYVPVRMFS